MNKPEIKIADGKLLVKASHSVDADADGKAAGSIAVELSLDLVEVLSEVVKKDMPLVEAILKQLKV